MYYIKDEPVKIMDTQGFFQGRGSIRPPWLFLAPPPRTGKFVNDIIGYQGRIQGGLLGSDEPPIALDYSAYILVL